MIFNGIDIEIERKPIKNLHLAVYPPDGRVHISVPIDYDDERIRMYILQKWIWIEEKREMLLSYNRLPERQYISGETHYFKGTKYRLKVNRHTSGAYSVLGIRHRLYPYLVDWFSNGRRYLGLFLLGGKYVR